MTVQQDVKRAGMRVMMAESMLGVPDYSADPNVIDRVGGVIGKTAGNEERHVRASDSITRSTSRVAALERPQWSAHLLWSVSIGISFCAVGLLAVLAYWYST
jgi:hypothetical protein